MFHTIFEMCFLLRQLRLCQRVLPRQRRVLRKLPVLRRPTRRPRRPWECLGTAWNYNRIQDIERSSQIMSDLPRSSQVYNFKTSRRPVLFPEFASLINWKCLARIPLMRVWMKRKWRRSWIHNVKFAFHRIPLHSMHFNPLRCPHHVILVRRLCGQWQMCSLQENRVRWGSRELPFRTSFAFCDLWRPPMGIGQNRIILIATEFALSLLMFAVTLHSQSRQCRQAGKAVEARP